MLIFMGQIVYDPFAQCGSVVDICNVGQLCSWAVGSVDCLSVRKRLQTRLSDAVK